jgi:hypothetical protein
LIIGRLQMLVKLSLRRRSQPITPGEMLPWWRSCSLTGPRARHLIDDPLNHYNMEVDVAGKVRKELGHEILGRCGTQRNYVA